ncbi:MAG: hypothetical protein ACLP7Q_05715 [Isosphaeraceae bacterium]
MPDAPRLADLRLAPQLLPIVRPLDPRDLPVERLKPIHVQHWVDAQPGWDRGKRGAITSVQRAFNWAAKMGLIGASPVRHVETPQTGRRDVVITPDEYAWTLDQVKDEPFRDLVVVSWKTGCRPREVLAVEARHVDLDGGRWVFPPMRPRPPSPVKIVNPSGPGAR